jgi:hypothetical protein
MKCYLFNLFQVRFLCLMLLTTHQIAAQQSSPSIEGTSNLTLGVLEDRPGTYAGESSVRVVRAIFEKLGSEWQSFPNHCKDVQCFDSLPKLYPKEVHWTVAFDGRNLGNVTGRTLADFRGLAAVGLEKIISSGEVPTVGDRLEKYSGFLFVPVYRPLVAISRPYFRDPDKWHPFRPSPSAISSVRQQFQNRFPKVQNCRNQNDGTLIPWKYRDENIQVIASYSSNNGWSLVDLKLAGWTCDGPQEDEDSPFIGQWFVVEPSGVTRHLASGMWLVDAGDYDNNGKSEVLFAVVGYNQGGYRLFYQDFSKSAEFTFRYH